MVSAGVHNDVYTTCEMMTICYRSALMCEYLCAVLRLAEFGVRCVVVSYRMVFTLETLQI